MDPEQKNISNNKSYIETILKYLIIYCFIETYIGEYIWSGFYAISSKIYPVIMLLLSIELLTDSESGLKKYFYYLILISVGSFLFNLSSFTGLFLFIKTYVFPVVILYWIRKFNSPGLLKIFIVTSEASHDISRT